jgi:hypothetical protein
LLIQSYQHGAFLINEDGNVLTQFRGAETSTFTPDRCTLVSVGGAYKLDGIRITNYSVEGEEINHKDIGLEPQYLDNYFNFSISNDQEWLSYLTVAQDPDLYDPQFAEKLYLSLLSTSIEKAAPIPLTPNGGAPFQGAVFSPDNRWIAYSDFDSKGIIQLYRMALNGKVPEQLTTFDNQYIGQRVGVIRYSPNSDMLAYTLFGEKYIPASIGILTLENQQISWLAFPEKGYRPTHLGDIWWNRTGTELLAWLENTNATTSNNFSKAVAIWFNVKSGEMMDVFPSKGVQSPLIEFLFPVTDLDKIVMHRGLTNESGPEYWLYDRRTGNQTKVDFPILCCSPYHETLTYSPVDISACAK